MIDIAEIKTRLENGEIFKYSKQEEKISFEDFKIIDINSNTIMVDGKKLSAYYPIS